MTWDRRRRSILGLALLVSFTACQTSVRGDESAAKPAAPVVFDLTLKGTLGEEPSAIGFDGSPIKDNLKGVIDRIGKAKVDPKVKGLVLRLNGLTIGLAKGYELRAGDHVTSGRRASGRSPSWKALRTRITSWPPPPTRSSCPRAAG